MMMDATYYPCQLDIADPSKFKDKSITVIGAGGIWAAIDSLQIPIEDAVEETGSQ